MQTSGKLRALLYDGYTTIDLEPGQSLVWSGTTSYVADTATGRFLFRANPTGRNCDDEERKRRKQKKMAAVKKREDKREYDLQVVKRESEDILIYSQQRVDVESWEDLIEEAPLDEYPVESLVACTDILSDVKGGGLPAIWAGCSEVKSVELLSQLQIVDHDKKVVRIDDRHGTVSPKQVFDNDPAAYDFIDQDVEYVSLVLSDNFTTSLCPSEVLRCFGFEPGPGFKIVDHKDRKILLPPTIYKSYLGSMYYVLKYVGWVVDAHSYYDYYVLVYAGCRSKILPVKES